jgi:hypothetical protein
MRLAAGGEIQGDPDADEEALEPPEPDEGPEPEDEPRRLPAPLLRVPRRLDAGARGRRARAGDRTGRRALLHGGLVTAQQGRQTALFGW